MGECRAAAPHCLGEIIHDWCKRKTKVLHSFEDRSEVSTQNQTNLVGLMTKKWSPEIVALVPSMKFHGASCP